MLNKYITILTMCSLVVIAIIVLALFYKPIEKSTEVVLRFNLPYDKPDPYFARASEQSLLYAIKDKKIETIYFNYISNSSPSKGLLHTKKRFIHHEIERLQFTNDTAVVLKIQLDEHNTYGDFVWLVNEANIYEYRRYAWIGNTFYMLPNDPPTGMNENYGKNAKKE